MSGNSGFSRSQTAPIVSSRVLPVAARGSSQEREPVLADLQLVPVGEPRRRLDPLAVEVGPVEAAEVLDLEPAAATPHDRVPPRDRDVVEEDVALRRAPDRRLIALEQERLPRAAAAGADDERGAVDAELGQLCLTLLLGLLGRERHRRLAALIRDEQRAALGAVVRGLGILETAFRAVPVAHAGGAALPVRMSVSASTSTCSSTLLPPDFWRRTTSSARRMSILPWRIRRR